MGRAAKRGSLIAVMVAAAVVGRPAAAHEPVGPGEVMPRMFPARSDFELSDVAADSREPVRRWAEQRRKLRIQLGVSAGLTAALVAIGALVLTVPCADPDPKWGCGEPYGRWITALTVFPAAAVAAIPTAVFGVRLYRHDQARPVALLQAAPGGFALRF